MRQGMNRIHKFQLYLAHGCLLLCFAARPAVAVREPYYQPHYCNNAFTYPQEIAEGKKAEQQVYKQMKVLPDSSPITKYVQKVGAKLTAFAPGYKWPYRFHVVQDKSINAFALPGGAIFVNTGTIAAAQNESELAGVMAHEISHVVQRHSTCNQTRQSKANVGWGLAGLIAGVLVPGVGGALAQQGVGMAQNLSYLQMSRTDEKQADLLGTEILANAGYNPRGLLQMFQIIQQESGSGGAQFLSDHPNPGDRVQYVEQEIAALPVRSNVITNTAEFNKIQQMVIRNQGAPPSAPVPVSSTPSASASAAPQPSLPSSISVSSNYALFRHQGYRLTYPDNWKVYGDSGSIVTIAPQGGIQPDASGQSQVAYGVIVDGFQPDQGSSLAEATRQLVERLRQSNTQLREIGSAESIQVDGKDARSVELESISPLGTSAKPVTERDWLVTVERPGGDLYYLVFIAPDPDYRALRPAFSNILDSLRILDSSRQ